MLGRHILSLRLFAAVQEAPLLVTAVLHRPMGPLLSARAGVSGTLCISKHGKYTCGMMHR